MQSGHFSNAKSGMKRLVILGSTGSIGENALRVVAALPERLKVVGLAANRNYRRLAEQARQFAVPAVAVADREGARRFAQQAPSGLRLFVGPEGVAELAGAVEADLVVCAMVGMSGLVPVLNALKSGKDVALATKEVLVAAGGLVMQCASSRRRRILPVDSEHSAIFQCLEGREPRHLRRLILTASGGPFAFREDIDLDRVAVAQALAHPTWRMGRKVTIDSATLMNKGLEIMEARWLFDVPPSRIDVLLHPESVVHSLVEFVDGVVLAQLSVPDMRFAIQYALLHPERADGSLPSVDLGRIGTLRFKEPDSGRFPCLRLAREVAEAGGTLPAVFSAANEVAVQKFLDGEISFSGIWRLVARVTERHASQPADSLEAVLEADEWARRTAAETKV